MNIKEMIKKRKAEVSTREVRFTANIGRYVIESAKPVYDRFGNMHHSEGIMFDMDFGGRTEPLDPSNPKHAELIEAGREEIDDPRMAAKVAKYGFREVKADAPERPVPKWEELSPKRLVDLVIELGVDLDQALDYEDSLGDNAREEVVALLMDARENGVPEKAADTAEPMIGD